MQEGKDELTNKINELINKFSTERYVTRQQMLYRWNNSYPFAEVWDDILKRRKELAISLDLFDQDNQALWFVPLPILNKIVERLERAAMYDIEDTIKDIVKLDEKMMDFIIDEAFHSSVIEGAVSTRKRTNEMIRKKQVPRNKSEKMILNNFEAMQFILENLDQPMSEDIFVQLHKIITKDTLETDDISEKYRDDDVTVQDPSRNEVIYVAPKATEVQGMMDNLFKFINTETPHIHPIIKACIIHFYLVYIHPFFDGNGRTTRAFTVFYLLKNGFHFFKYLSISTAIMGKRNKYYQAILDCEKNPTDVTYFILNQLELMQNRATDLLHELKVETGMYIVQEWLKKNKINLSDRQVKQIQNFIKGKKNIITITEYMKKYKISYETARTDLAELYALDIVEKMKQSRTFVYKFDLSDVISKMLKSLDSSE